MFRDGSLGLMVWGLTTYEEEGRDSLELEFLPDDQFDLISMSKVRGHSLVGCMMLFDCFEELEQDMPHEPAHQLHTSFLMQDVTYSGKVSRASMSISSVHISRRASHTSLHSRYMSFQQSRTNSRIASKLSSCNTTTPFA